MSNGARLLLAAAIWAVFATAPAAAQGVGSAGAEILQITAGTRAAALGGAYTAVIGDPDAVFYNPASVAWLRQGAALGYQAYVEDVSLGSLSGAMDAGPLAVGGGLLFLDAGTIPEVVPDPAYGGERGRETGEEVGASEAAARVAAALTFAGGRAAAGAAIGVVTSDMAGVSRTAAFVDAGAQLRVRDDLALGLALRHLGAGLSNDAYGDAPLPAQARLGATYHRAVGSAYSAQAFADAAWGVEEETLGLAVGLEAGLQPTARGVSAALRAGATLGEGEDHLGRIRFGGGVSLGTLSLDYALQIFDYLGTIHRVGLRWTR